MSPSSLVCLTLLLVSFTISEARDFSVGGDDRAWRLPPTPADSLNRWAEKNRFQVGDSLDQQYDDAKDSVLQVTREAYLSCNRSSPVAEHRDGATAVELHRSGAYYFISGAEGACEQGEKLIVVVMSERHSLRGGLAPAPGPTEFEGPAVAPTSGASTTVVLKSGVAAALLVLGMTL
ncbi:unnamed protein product [Musa textilis]